jgi:hypothetical protein
LTPYAEEDARFFFGREEDTQLIVANLFSARVTVLFGPSGVGKSSILRAGAIRDLRQRQREARQRGERPDLLIVYFRTWQGKSMEELRRTVLEDAAELAGKPVEAPKGGTLADLLAYVASTLTVDIMLLLDQFEEYFRYETRFGAPESFAVQFAEAVGRVGLPASFLLSLREDSLAELDRFKTLVPNLFTNWYRLDRLGLEAAAQAIRGPVEEYNKLPDRERKYGGEITLDEGLAEEVLRQVRTGAVRIGDVGKGAARKEQASIETPYLQLVLTELWDEELAHGSRRLRVETLERLGGATAIVQRHVDSVMAALSAREREMCVCMFDYLVTDSGAKIAYRAKDLAEKAEVDEASMQTLLGKLAEGDRRILTTVAPSPDHPTEPQYEIYHDSLSRAVIAWRRRFVESQRGKRLAVRIFAAAGVMLALFLAYGWYRSTQLERAATVAEAQAAKAKVAEFEARAQQATAEVVRAQHELEDLRAQKGGSAEEIRKLNEEIKKRQEEAAKYQKVASDLQYKAPQAVPNDAVELATNRANRAEAERDQFRTTVEQLMKERTDLQRQLEVLRASTVQQTTAPSLEQVICRLERVRVIEDGSVGDTDWRFQVTVRAAAGDPVNVSFPLTLNDTSKPLMVLNKDWPVTVDAAKPLAFVEVRGSRSGAKGARFVPPAPTVVHADIVLPPTTVAAGYADGSRARQMVFLMPNPKDGLMVFEFSLVRGASKK